MHYNLQAYYKIKKCAEEITCEEQIYCIKNMIQALVEHCEFKLAKLRCSVFGWNIFKWKSNYKYYSQYQDQSIAISNELSELLQTLIDEYNKAVEQLLAESQNKTFVVKGFADGIVEKTPKKRKKRKNKDE